MKKIFSILLCFFVCFFVYADTISAPEQLDRATIENSLEQARKILAFEKEQYELTKSGNFWAHTQNCLHVVKIVGDAASITANLITIFKGPAVEAALKGREGLQLTMVLTRYSQNLHTVIELVGDGKSVGERARDLNTIISNMKADLELLHESAEFIKKNSKQLGIAGKALDSFSLIGNLFQLHTDIINLRENWSSPSELKKRVELAQKEYEEAKMRVEQLEAMLKKVDELEKQEVTTVLTGGVSMDVQVLEDGTIIAPDENGGYTTCYPDGRVTHTDKNGKTTTVDNNQTETDSQQTIPDPDTESYTGVFGDILNGDSTTAEEAGDIVIETTISRHHQSGRI